MNWHDACLILTIFLGAFGLCFLAAGFLSFNAVVGERSRTDGRVLIEKQLSGSTRDERAARSEIAARLPEVWAKQWVTRWLVYTGASFFVVACFLSPWATPLQALRNSPPPNHALQRTGQGGTSSP